ncbi:hypothetical protein BTJ39_22765 [Izhakiella australiensis]|uniref:Uncharacterized protein n=1 Tax=Izhakiella australiensis TaxID=1926881 RepID=A0A1S8Y9G4_9GAMM|nr:hypothetical protein BTJ39_22765 [Izhakiella australiensis]
MSTSSKSGHREPRAAVRLFIQALSPSTLPNSGRLCFQNAQRTIRLTACKTLCHPTFSTREFYHQRDGGQTRNKV